MMEREGRGKKEATYSNDRIGFDDWQALEEHVISPEVWSRLIIFASIKQIFKTHPGN